MTWHGYLEFGAMSLLSFVFTASALGKTRNIPEFVTSLRRIVPYKIANTAAFVIVFLEVGIVLTFTISLLDEKIANIGYVLSTGLLITFNVGIMMAIRGGEKIPCVCFGRAGGQLSLRHMVRNTVLVAVSLTGLILLDRSAPMELQGVVAAALVSAVLAVMISVMDTLLSF